MSFSLADAIELDVLDMHVEGTHFPIAVAPLKDLSVPYRLLVDAEVIDRWSLHGMLHSFRQNIIEILITKWLPFHRLPNPFSRIGQHRVRYMEVLFRAEQFGSDFSEYFIVDRDAFEVLVDFASLPYESGKVNWIKDGF